MLQRRPLRAVERWNCRKQLVGSLYLALDIDHPSGGSVAVFDNLQMFEIIGEQGERVEHEHTGKHDSE